MKKMVKITLNLLNEKVKENLSQIQKNQKAIQKLLKKQDCGSKDELEKNFTKNKCLLAENIDFIYLQLNLTNSIEKGREKTGLDQYSTPILKKVNECFELTMDGFLIYNSIQSSDSENVIHRLRNYYQQLENYKRISRF